MFFFFFNIIGKTISIKLLGGRIYNSNELSHPIDWRFCKTYAWRVVGNLLRLATRANQ